MNKQKEDKENLWNQILNETALSSNSFRDSNLIVLGEKESGKRTLINTIMKNNLDDFSNELKLGLKGLTSSLEYTYLPVRNPDDPENDDAISKMNIWVMDEPEQDVLLKSCIKEGNIQNTAIAICIDMKQVNKSIELLSQWMNIITGELALILKDMPLKKQDELRNKLKKSITSYEQPKFDEDGKLERKTMWRKTVKEQSEEDDNADSEEEKEELEVELPLHAGVLDVNYGVPIIIICTKTDAFEGYQRDKDYDQKMDFLQYTLRKYALTYGATVLYTSSQLNINTDILYDFLLHKFYDFGLKYSPEVIHKDSVFVPSGYDNPKILEETFNFSETFIIEDLFPNVEEKKNTNKEELIVEDTQAFLKQLKDKLGTVEAQRPHKTMDPSSAPENKDSKDKKPEEFLRNLMNKDGSKQRDSIQGKDANGSNGVPTRRVQSSMTVTPTTMNGTKPNTSTSKGAKLMDLLKK